MLKAVLVIIFVLITGESTHGRIFSKCELARELVEVHNATLREVKGLTCVAELSSGFDTQYSYGGFRGIFNISCGSCNISCSALTNNDIADDYLCARETSNYYDMCISNSELTLSDCGYEENASTSSRILDVLLESGEEIIGDVNASDTSGESQSTPAHRRSDYQVEDNNFQTSAIDTRAAEVEEARSYYDENLEKLQIIQYLLGLNSRTNVRYIFLFL